MPTLEVLIDARRARRGASEFSRAVDEVRGGARRAADAADVLDASLKGLSRSVELTSRLFLRLSAYLAIVASVREAVQTIAEYSKTMAELRGTTQATEETFQRFIATTREVGGSTVYSASEAAEGLLYLARAGFSADESIRALPATATLAVAGVLELGESADLVSNVMSQFALATGDAMDVADTLVYTANNTNTNVEQLAVALEYTGAIASATGQSLEETAAAIGLLGNRGIQASMAGTNLRGILTTLTAPTKKARDTIESMGLTLEEIDPTINSLSEIFEKFAAANLSAEEASAIFQKRNAGAALILAASADEVRTLTAAYEENRGVAEENARYVEESLWGAFRRLRNTIKEAALELGENGLEGALRSSAETAGNMVRLLAGINSEATKADVAANVLASSFRALTAAALAFGAVKIGSGLSSVLASTVLHTNAMRAAVVSTSLALGAGGPFQAAMTAASLSVKGLGLSIKALWASLGPGGWLILGITAVGTAIFEFNAYSERMADRIEETARRMHEMNKATVDAAEAGERMERIRVQQARAVDLQDPRARLVAIRREMDELEKLREDIIIESGLLPTGDYDKPELRAYSPTVDVEQIRKVFGEAGSEALEAFLEGFRSDPDYSQINRVFLPQSWEFQRLNSIADSMEYDLGAPLIRPKPPLSKIPSQDAVQLIEQRIAAVRELAKAQEELTRQSEALANAQASEDFLSAYLQDLAFETSLIGKSRAEREALIQVRRVDQAAAREEIELTERQRLTLYQAVMQLEARTEAEERAADIARELIRQEEQRAERLEEAREAMMSYLDAMRRETELMSLNEDEREKAEVRLRAEALAKEAGVDVSNDYVDALLREVDAQQRIREEKERAIEAERQLQAARREAERRAEEAARLERSRAEARAEAQQRVAESLLELETELSLIGRATEVRERAAKVRQFEADVIHAFLGEQELLNRRMEEYRGILDDLQSRDPNIVDAARERYNELLSDIERVERIDQMVLRFGQSIGDAFVDMAMGATSATKAIQDLLESLSRLILQETLGASIRTALQGPLSSFFGIAGGATAGVGATQADGGLWSHGRRVHAFAKGDLFTSPRTFGIAGTNDIGLMAEDGPEYIMPAARGPDGKLGVRAIGGGGGPRIVNNFYISTPNVQSFGYAQRQIAQDARRGSLSLRS